MTQWLALPSLPTVFLTVPFPCDSPGRPRLKVAAGPPSQGPTQSLCPIHSTQGLACSGHQGTLLAKEVMLDVSPSASHLKALRGEGAPPDRLGFTAHSETLDKSLSQNLNFFPRKWKNNFLVTTSEIRSFKQLYTVGI